MESASFREKCSKQIENGAASMALRICQQLPPGKIASRHTQVVQQSCPFSFAAFRGTKDDAAIWCHHCSETPAVA